MRAKWKLQSHGAIGAPASSECDLEAAQILASPFRIGPSECICEPIVAFDQAVTPQNAPPRNTLRSLAISRGCLAGATDEAVGEADQRSRAPAQRRNPTRHRSQVAAVASAALPRQ